MSHQRTDHQVITDIETKRATTDALKRVLRRQGIRDPHTNRKAREAIRIAASAELSRGKQIAMGVKR